MYGNERIVEGQYERWRYAVPVEERLTDQQIQDQVALFMVHVDVQEDREAMPQESGQDSHPAPGHGAFSDHSQ